MAELRRNGGRERVSARKWREEVRGGNNYLRLPPGVSFFSAKPGVYRLDFMSYVAGKGNPRAEPGEVYFERTFFVHQGIGPNQEWHICLSRTFNQPCPVCEYRAKLSANPSADEDLIKSLAPKERQLWLVKDLINDPDGVMVWDVSYHLFGRSLKEKIIHADEEDGYDYFADPVEGLTLRVALQQSERGKWTEVGDIEFRPRKRQYPPDIVEQMPCLDDMLVPTPYDKLKALLLQTNDQYVEKVDEEDPGEVFFSRKGSNDRDEEDEPPRFRVGDHVRYKGMQCEVVRVSGDGTSLVLEDEDNELIKAVSVDDVEKAPRQTEPVARRHHASYEDDDREEEGSKPVKIPSKGPVKPKASRTDEDDLDREEDAAPKGGVSKRLFDEDKGKEKGKLTKEPAKPKTKKVEEEDDWDDWDE